jgi:translocation and assembly module TamB
METRPRKKLGRARKAIAVVAATVGTLATFSLAAVGGVLLHLDLPAGRRTIVHRATEALAESFRGTIRIDRLEHVGLHGLRGVDVIVLDPEGRTAVVAQDVSLAIDVPRLVVNAISGKGDLVIPLTGGHASHVEAALLTEPDGTLGIANAFLPREEKPKEPPKGRPVRIEIPGLEIAHGWVHGNAGLPLIDVDVERLRTSIHVADVATRIEVERLAVRTRSLPNRADLEGNIEAALVLPSEPAPGDTAPRPEAMYRGHYEGRAGGIPLTASGSMDGERIDAMVDVPRTDAESVRALVPEAPLFAPASVHAEAKGTVADVTAHVLATVGEGSVDVQAHATIAQRIAGTATVMASRMRPRDFAPTGPLGTVTASVQVKGAREANGAIAGDFSLRSEATRLAGQVVPAVDASGAFTQASVKGVARVHEIGAPTQVRFDVHPRPGGEKPELVAFDLKTQVKSLAQVPRLGPVGRGAVDLHASGEVDLGASSIDARADARLQHVARADLTLDEGWVTADVRGRFDDPRIVARIAGKNLRAGEYFFAEALVTARGSARRPFVTANLDPGREDAPRIKAQAQLDTTSAVLVRNAEIVLERDDVTMTTRIASVRSGPRGIELAGVRVEGLGEPLEGEAKIGPRAIAVKARGEDVDLTRVSRLFAIDEGLDQGHVRLALDLATDKKKALHGTFAVGLSHVTFRKVEDGSVDVDGAIDDRNASLSIKARLGETGSLDLDAPRIELSGPADRADSWRNAVFDARIDGTVDLDRLSRTIPAEMLPLDKAAGIVTLAGTIAHRKDVAVPDVDLRIATRGLELMGKTPEPTRRKIEVDTHEPQQGTSDAAEVLGGGGQPRAKAKESVKPDRPDPAPGTSRVPGIEKPTNEPVAVPLPEKPPWHSVGMDGEIQLRIDGKKERAVLDGKLVDPKGLFATVHVDTEAPLSRAMAGKATPADLRGAKFDASVRVPERTLEDLPLVVRPSGMKGTVSLFVEADGTVSAPELDARVEGRGVSVTDSPLSLPMDGVVAATYDGHHGEVDAHVTRNGAVLLDGKTTVDLEMDQALSGKRLPPGWGASSEIRMAGFPLHSLFAVTGQAIEGCISGVIRLEGLHHDPKLQGRLSVTNLRLGDVVFPRGNVAFDARDGSFKGEARLEQTDGYVSARGEGEVRWQENVAPTPIPGRPVVVDVDAQGFRLAAGMPFVDGALDQLDGRMDAKMHLETGASRKEGKAHGYLAIHKGKVEIPAMGQELRNIEARITLAEDGKIRIEEMRMKGQSGRIEVTGEAELEGTTLRHGRASVRAEDRLPLTVQGVSLGEVEGGLDIEARTPPGSPTTEVSVTVSSLHMELPATAGNKVQELEDEPTVKIGVHRPGDERDARFVLLPLAPPPRKPKPDELTKGSEAAIAKAEAPPPVRLTVTLGKDVRIRKGTQMQMYLTGKTVVELRDEPDVTGQIQLAQGRVEVLGKRFRIERGTVTFHDDPANPDVLVTAYWDAPDGTRVLVDYIGPVKTGKLTLRAEPSLSQDEIVALVLFGTTTGSVGAARPGDQSNTTKAAGLGGGVATQGLNKAISNVTEIDVQTRIDTSDAQNPRPELAVQLSRKVTAEIAYNMGLPSPGQNPDKTLFILDYRFARNWSFMSTFGDRGSSLFDAIWQYRYLGRGDEDLRLTSAETVATATGAALEAGEKSRKIPFPAGRPEIPIASMRRRERGRSTLTQPRHIAVPSIAPPETQSRPQRRWHLVREHLGKAALFARAHEMTNGSLGDVVMVIADPDGDSVAVELVRAAADTRGTLPDFQGITVVALPVKLGAELLRVAQPEMAESLRDEPEVGFMRVLCVAAGGARFDHLPIVNTYRGGQSLAGTSAIVSADAGDRAASPTRRARGRRRRRPARGRRGRDRGASVARSPGW